METTKEESKPQEETDERGVPLINKVKELERKMQEKYEKELAETRRELQELKSSYTPEPTPEPVAAPSEDMSKAELMEFVKNPKAYVQARFQEQEAQRQQETWKQQVPEAESWIKSQKGYSSDDDAKIFQIIKENKLDTPYHSPMERAQTAWKFLSVEKREKELNSMTDDEKRQASVSRNSTEGSGKSTPKQAPTTRADIVKKLAIAEAKGDLDASIKYMGMLEDIRE